MNGTIVVDGVLGDYFDSKYGLLGKNPVTYVVKDGFVDVDKIRCANPDLLNDLKNYLTQDKNANRVGEFAIGTNLGITHLIGNMLQDEKVVGFHFATGNPYPDKTGADWKSKAHLDGIIIKPTITVDGKTIMENGKFTQLIIT